MSRYNKYRVAPKAARTLDGIVFDSKKEMNRYCELKILQKARVISELELQPRFDLVVNGRKCGFYKADFRYFMLDKKKYVVEDVKGVRTPVYRLKKKLVEAIHGIVIAEV